MIKQGDSRSKSSIGSRNAKKRWIILGWKGSIWKWDSRDECLSRKGMQSLKPNWGNFAKYRCRVDIPIGASHHIQKNYLGDDGRNQVKGGWNYLLKIPSQLSIP